MTDYTRDALGRLREIAKRDSGIAPGLWSDDARAILAHIAALEAECDRRCADLSEVEEDRGRWRQRAERAERRESTACEHCGAQVSSYPNGCPGCGAPQCCQPCCDRQNATDRAEAAEADAARLRAALEQIGIYGCGMLNQPAAMNGPEESWLRRRIEEYERTARQALAAAPAAPESRESRAAKLERLLREARADVEYIADAESGSAEGAASRDLLADIDAALEGSHD